MRTRKEMIDYLVEHQDKKSMLDESQIRESLEKLDDKRLVELIENMNMKGPGQ